MAVQPPVLFDNLGFPANGSSQDWIGMAANSGFGLPHPFPNPVQIDALHHNAATFAPSAATPNLHPPRFSNALTQEFERQTRQIDIFLQLQNERLRCALQQQNKKQITTLLNSIEPNALARVRQTEQDLATVTRRTRELEECLKMAEMEAEAWKRMAMENEAMVLGLNNMLGQARESLCWASINGGPAQDSESVCECDWAEGGKTAVQENETAGGVGTRKTGCKGCKTQRSCVVFLPCKHLCACRECASLLAMCPVCKSVKEGTVEVFFD